MGEPDITITHLSVLSNGTVCIRQNVMAAACCSVPSALDGAAPRCAETAESHIQVEQMNFLSLSGRTDLSTGVF